MEKSFIEIDDPRVELAAVKKGEWDDSLVLRLVNPTDDEVAARVTFGFPVASAMLTNLKETESLGKLDVTDGSVVVVMPPRKIVTLRLGA